MDQNAPFWSILAWRVHFGPFRSANRTLAIPEVYWQAMVAQNLVVLQEKERMSHLYDSTVAGPTARRDNVLASKCEYHSNRNVYQTNSPEFEVGNGKNYQRPKKSF